MRLELPAEVVEFRAEVAAFLDRNVSPDLRHEVERHHGRGGGRLTGELWRALGKAGYLGIAWPKQYGGSGKSFLYLDALFCEMFERDLPMPETALLTIGPTLMKVGSKEQQARYLPGIISGEDDYALGYSEPQSGTDLAGLKTRAVATDDGFVISGQKVYTSRAEYCRYIWLAARTDPERPRNDGISVFIVPTDAPGVRVAPLRTMARVTNVTFYDDVRVPADALVGELNKGWGYITSQLALERLTVSPIPELERLRRTLNAIAGDCDWLRGELTAFEADLQAFKALRLRILSQIERGENPAQDVAILKIASNECRVRMLGVAMQAVGPRALIQDRDDDDAFLEGGSDATLEYQQRSSFINLFGGGSNDILRDLIASRALGMSR